MLILIKFVDNLISSSKSIHTHELNTVKVFMLSILKAIMFMIIITEVADSSIWILILASIGAGVGSAIPVFLANKKRDKIEEIWRYNIKCRDVSEGEKLKQIFESNGIETYATENIISSKSTIIVTAISHGTKDSNIIMGNIEKGRKVTVDKGIESFVKR